MTRLRFLAPLIVLVVCLDCTTKELAVTHLQPAHVPHPIVGEVLRFTLAFNQGAAMSLPVGNNPRWPLAAVAIAALLVLGGMIAQTSTTDRWRLAALGLIVAGAFGNLLDRIRSARGVVDFVDMGLGSWRFWIFNVADVAITLGAVLLLVHSLRVRSQEDERPAGWPRDRRATEA